MKTKIENEPFKEVLENFELYLRNVPSRNGKLKSESAIKYYTHYIEDLAEFLRDEW